MKLEIGKRYILSPIPWLEPPLNRPIEFEIIGILGDNIWVSIREMDGTTLAPEAVYPAWAFNSFGKFISEKEEWLKKQREEQQEK